MYPRCPYAGKHLCKDFPNCRKGTHSNLNRGARYDKACLVTLSITDQMIETETNSEVEGFVSES